MLGIGPLLPVTTVADTIDCCERKLRKRGDKLNAYPGTHKLANMRRPSTIETELTLVESNDEYIVNVPDDIAHQQRDLSLIVDFDPVRAAGQLNKGDISDLDFALFVFWIKAKSDNYTMAKSLVRELALDQGYNVDKIINQRVRKLLQEVHDIRPRDPRHVSTWDCAFHNRAKNSAAIMDGGTRVSNSPLTARMDTLPPSLRLKRELAVQKAARPAMVRTDNADYPPNTPDRPAPLSVRSRSSQISTSTPLPNAISRSVSSPIRSQMKEDLQPLAKRLPSTTAGDFETLSFLPSSTAGAFHSTTGDVCDETKSKQLDCGSLFISRLNKSGDRRHGTVGRVHMQNEYGNSPPSGQYQLNTSDAASESSYERSSILVHMNQHRVSSSHNGDGGIIRDASFEALESYVGTEDDEECSLLESASIDSDQQGQTEYHFATSAPVPHSVIAGPIPTPSERRLSAETRRKSRGQHLVTPAVNLHRPLPLRSYESKATMFSSAGAHTYSGRNRSKSVTGISNSTRCAAEAIQHPPLPALNQATSSTDHMKQKSAERDNLHTKIFEQVDRDLVFVSQRSSNTPTLAAFPIPPMDNPVGELPILVSRAATSPSARQQASLQQLTGASSLEDAYRAITIVNMKIVLQRTRSRGEQLKVIDWGKLTSFERAWRDMNAVLLVTIYGRKDVFLDESDVAYIDCVAKELCNGTSETDSIGWICRIFEDRT